MKLWDKGYDIDRFTEEFTIGKDKIGRASCRERV